MWEGGVRQEISNISPDYVKYTHPVYFLGFQKGGVLRMLAFTVA